MAQTYRLVGSQDPASRIDRVLVESPSDDYPEGKSLNLNGDPVELSDDQVAKLSSYARLEAVSDEESEQVEQQGEALPQFADQPGGSQRYSSSTDVSHDDESSQEASAPDQPAQAQESQANPAVQAASKKGDK